MPLLLILILLQINGSEKTETYSMVPEESIVAIVTHKAGIASKFAHNHLITAHAIDLELTVLTGDTTQLHVVASIPVDSLKVDDPVMRNQWASRIAELDIEDDLGSPGEKDRRKIRSEMMSRKQLAAVDHDSITATLLNSIGAPIEFECNGEAAIITMRVSIRGSENPIKFSTCYLIQQDSMFVEALGHATFREFGIKPFSGVLGTVKNKNEFDIYVNITATKED